MSLTKQQSVLTHTVRITEISARTDSWVTNTPSAKKIVSTKKLLILVFSYKHNMLKCWSINP